MKRHRPSHERFGAPMALSLKIITALVIVVVVTAGFLPLFLASPATTPRFALLLGPLLCGVLLLVIPLFAVRGFEIHHRELLIQRPLWWTRVPLKGLVSAEADPQAMKGSIRLMGNGGFFAYTGLFRNRKLGKYRAFVTDPSRSVVLKFDDRTVVVSPEDPTAFVRSLGFEPEAREGRS
jgi:hypothetical protein